MSSWTYVHGTIVVSPLGRTQHEKRYILETVLDHLPVVTGSERDMEVYVIQKRGYNSSSSSDEFFEGTNNLRDSRGRRSINVVGYIHKTNIFLLLMVHYVIENLKKLLKNL